ncbi:MAG: hypothetical protein FWF25_04670, partial [Propionibacteriaceae bacterium]|nr:hypothetical protein [Propionibacteriaceae bacterium]
NADSDGLVTFSFTVPEGTPAGTQTVTVTGATSGSVSTTFEVLSSSKISVATGGVVIPRVSLSVTLIRLAVVMATVARG